MKLRGSLVVAMLAFAVFYAGNAGTSSATVLCKIQLPECPGNALPVPETLSAPLMTGTSAVFSQTTGATCKSSTMELKTTSNLGFGEPLLATITSWTFGTCTPCTTVTANTPFEAEFIPIGFQGDGELTILFPEFKLSGCPNSLVCVDTAESITLSVLGGEHPMKWIASAVPLRVSGTRCGSTATLSAKHLVTPKKFEELWLEPVP